MLPQLFCKSTARNQLNKDKTNTHHMSAILPPDFCTLFQRDTVSCLALGAGPFISKLNEI